jgi:hypothetical protein
MDFSARRVFWPGPWSHQRKLLEAEITGYLGYEKYPAIGRNTGNSRNGKVSRKIRSSAGETQIRVPRDRNGEFEPTLLKKYAHNTNELKEKILGLYAKGLSTYNIADRLAEMYGMEVPTATISTIIDKILPLVEGRQNRPLTTSSTSTLSAKSKAPDKRHQELFTFDLRFPILAADPQTCDFQSSAARLGLHDYHMFEHVTWSQRH